MDEIKAEQIAKIDWLERQATAAWFRSVQGAGSEAVPQELTPTGNAGNGERLFTRVGYKSGVKNSWAVSGGAWSNA